MSAFCCDFLIIPAYIHIVEQSWSTQTGLLSGETKTEAVPQRDIHLAHSNQQLAFSAEQS